MVNWMKYKYSWAPFTSALMWAATLIALFVLWRTDGPPYYKQNRTILYISYVGSKWKGLFVPGAVLTSIAYFITLILDVELRRHERIPNFLQRRETIFAILSIIFGTVGAISLSGLAIFDVHNFHTAHWVFTTLFIVDVFLNGLFNLFEIKYLARGHYQLGYLRRNAFAKLFIAGIALACAIAFAILQAVCTDNGDDAFDKSCNVVDSTAAVLEWAIAVLFVGFLITYIIDFRAVESPPAALRAMEAQDHATDVPAPQARDAELQQRAGPKPSAAESAPVEVGSGIA